MSLLSAVLECVTMEATRNEEEERKEIALIISEVRAAASELSERLRSSRPAEAAAASKSRRKHLAERLNRVRDSLILSEFPDFPSAEERFERANALADRFERLRAADSSFERRKYREASELYEAADADPDLARRPDELDETSERLRRLLAPKKARCIREITRQWRQGLEWGSERTGDDRRISFSATGRDPESFHEALEALFASDRINAEAARIADFLVETALPALSLHKCTVAVHRDSADVVAHIRHRDALNRGEDVESVVDNIVTFVDAVQSAIDCRWEDDRSVFSVIGKAAGARLFNAPLEYFARIAPADKEAKIKIGLQIQKLNDYFCEVGLGDREGSPLSELASRISSTGDIGPDDLLCLARELMKRDLRENITEVCVDRPSKIHIDEIRMLEAATSDRNILNDPFILHHCCISESVKKIMEMIIKKLVSAQTSSVNCQGRTISIVRNILEMYSTFVPHHHKQSLKMNPVDLALFYNNCMYLAHSIIGFPWSKNFTDDYSRNIMMQLSDQIQNLRTTAVLEFSSMIKMQVQKIENEISNSDLLNLNKMQHIGNEAEVVIYNCLNILKTLRECWQSILSKETYENAFIYLIDGFSKQLTDIVLTVKEITIFEDLACDISNLYQQVLDDIPKLFCGEKDLRKLSRNFSRLVELVALLKTPMNTIGVKWQSNKSHISKIFSCEEIKHLTRIMFPSSSQKSIVLDKIK